MSQRPNEPRLHIPGPIVIVLFLVGMVVFGVLLAAFSYLALPPQASIQAQNTDSLFRILLLIGGMIFFLVQGLLLYSVVKFRAHPTDTEDGVSIHGNATLEIVWTVIPAVIVFVLAILSFIVWNNNIAPQENPNLVDGQSIQVHAVGQRYAWSFEYTFDADMPVAPEDGDVAVAGAEVTPEAEMTPEAETTPEAVAESDETSRQTLSFSASELHTYVGQNVELTISSPDVIHSFWVPAMRIKQDALPGYETLVRFTPTMVEEINGEPVDYPVTYPIRCAELCGGGHGEMVAELIVHENEEAFLDAFFAEERDLVLNPPDDPILLGRRALESNVYGCAGCHVLDELGWSGITGPSQNGLAERAGDRVDGISAEEYLIQSLRQPAAYTVPPGNWSANMTQFVSDPDSPNYMPIEDVVNIVAYLCTLTDTGSTEASDCNLLDFDDPAQMQETLTELAEFYE